MKELKSKTLFDSLAVITDPCPERHKRHSLIDNLVVALWFQFVERKAGKTFEEFSIAKHEWSATFIELKNWILNHDTFRRVFILLDAEELIASYLERITTLKKILHIIIGRAFIVIP